MKKISLILVILIFVIVGIGATAISMIDWNDYKSEISEKISDVTDKKVIFDGPISLSLFPYPYLNAQNVRVVDNSVNGQRNLAQIKSLVVNVDLISLLKGDLEMQRVALVEPRIDFEVMKNEQLNWYSPMSYERREKLLLMDISLESVTIEKGTVVFRDDKRGINALYNKFNAEIIADNIFGPYRIEGSFIKDNKPAGFAVSIGGFSESSTTDVSFVLTQPEAEASMMFNGTYNVATIGNSLNGDVTFEVKKINEFLSVMSPGTKIDAKYDMPIALTSTMKVNKSKIDLSNMVIKYGKSLGAGKADVIFAKEEISKNGEEKLNNKVKVNTKLEFTNYDVEPLLYTVKNFYNVHKQKNSKFELPEEYELNADISVSEAIYNSGKIKDAKLKLKINEEQIEISDFGVMLPGSCYFTADGFIKPLNNILYYDIDLNINSTRTNTFLKWLGINTYNPTNSLYKSASFKGKLNGNLNNIMMNDVQFALDRTAFDGDIEIGVDGRKYYSVTGEIDEFNFDTYLPKTPENIMNKSLRDRVLYKFSQLGYLNDFDANVKVKTELLVYGQIPFENIDIDADLKNGILSLNKFDVPNAAAIKFYANGKLKGFGDKPYFENIKYEFDTKDISNIFKRLRIDENKYFTGKNLMSKGEFSGDLTKFSLKSSSVIGDAKLQNAGVFERAEGNLKYSAVVKLEHKDFLKMLEELDVKYEPNAISLGIFRLNGKLKGDLKKIDVKSLKASIGKDNFDGELNIDLSSEKPLIVSNLKIDNFQMDRYLSKNPYKEVDGKKTEAEKEVKTLSVGSSTFLPKPDWSSKEVDYSILDKFNVKSSLQFGKLILGKYVFDRFVTNVDLTNSIMKLSGIKSEYNGAFVVGNLDFTFSGEPAVKGDIKIDNLKVSNGFEKGRIFDFQTDVLNTKFTFESKITSSEKFVKSLNSKIDFDTNKIILKGINLQKISKSIKTVNKSKDVEKLIKENVSNGSDVFSESYGVINIDRGKATFTDIFFNSEDVALTLNNVTSLIKWDVNASMLAEFLQYPDLPKLEITMKDSLSIPVFNADYSNIENYYKNIEAKEAKRIQDEKDKIKAELRKFTSEKVNIVISQKQVVESLINDMKAEIVGITDASILDKSKRVENTYNKILSNIDETEKINRKPEITKELFSKVEGYLLENNRLVSDFGQDVEDVIFSCLRLKSKNNMKIVSDHVDIANKAIEEFRNLEINKFEQLSKFNTKFKLLSDEKYIELSNSYKIYRDDLYVKSDMASSDFDKSQKSRIVEEMKLYIKNLDDYAKSISVVTDDLKKVIAELTAVMDGFLNKEIAKREEIKKEKEVAKKVEESKGSLSVRGKTQKFGLTKEDVLSTINGKKISNDNNDKNVDSSNDSESTLILDFSKKEKEKQSDKKISEKSGKVYRF